MTLLPFVQAGLVLSKKLGEILQFYASLVFLPLELFGFVNIMISEPLEYPKLGEIWQELKWLFYGGENGFQGNRGNGKLLKRCQPRRAASNSQNIGKYQMGNH